jgi:NAD-dependent SIR2 family protein deacetylase
MKHVSNEYCDICKNYHDFDFPEDLFEEFVKRDVVVFAGAGISTENKNIFPLTLYESILLENNNLNDKNLSFSRAMSEFCKNKGGRRDLIERISKRIDYVRSFPELYRSAVTFHNNLARIPCITEIVTTNWDDFFETECHATPYVYESDMVFWEKPGRKVLKLHGSINNLGSIVVTFEDYEKKYKSLDSGLVGSQLKLLIAKKKLVFIGYSFNDEDFNRIFSFVIR